MVTPRKFSGQGKHIVKDLYLNGGPILPSTVVYRRLLHGNIMFFDEQLKRAEDAEFWLRYLQHAKIELCSEVLIRRRVHDKSLSANIAAHFASQIALIEKINYKIPWLRRYEKSRLIAIHRNYFKRQIKDQKYGSALLTLYKLVGVLIRKTANA